jgi:hypothetical protein
MNRSKIQRATSSVFVRAMLTFCRHSPQLILRLYYVFIAAISPGRYLHQRGQLRRSVATIPELIVSLNTSAFYQY